MSKTPDNATEPREDAPAPAAEPAPAPAYAVPPWAVTGDNNACRYEVDAEGVPLSVMFRNPAERDARLPGILNAPILADELRHLAALVEGGEVDEARARIASHVRPLLAPAG